MTMDGIDFDASKIKIAELLPRSDLIKTKRGGGTSQKMTAAALLYAPANRRDDSLPVRYLAHRLGVNVADVPVPATPMVGLQALAYYEPAPPGSPEKATSIGEFPCAVFGTVAADGGVHAMRVYLAPGGAGKAELGVDRDGDGRDPKKSATALANDTTGGRSVRGDSAAAPHIVVTEGIETGAAVALALKAEIEAGEIAIAAAITAGGVEAFQPYPATKRVTIAADRDEALKPGKKKISRRGEIATRNFGLKHYEELAVAIALPGTAGEAIDWLDILLRGGAEAVCNENSRCSSLCADAEGDR